MTIYMLQCKGGHGKFYQGYNMNKQVPQKRSTDWLLYSVCNPMIAQVIASYRMSSCYNEHVMQNFTCISMFGQHIVVTHWNDYIKIELQLIYLELYSQFYCIYFTYTVLMRVMLSLLCGLFWWYIFQVNSVPIMRQVVVGCSVLCQFKVLVPASKISI